ALEQRALFVGPARLLAGVIAALLAVLGVAVVVFHALDAGAFAADVLGPRQTVGVGRAGGVLHTALFRTLQRAQVHAVWIRADRAAGSVLRVGARTVASAADAAEAVGVCDAAEAGQRAEAADAGVSAIGAGGARGATVAALTRGDGPAAARRHGGADARRAARDRRLREEE